MRSCGWLFVALIAGVLAALPVAAAERYRSLPAEAVAKLDLQFHRVQVVPVPPPPPPANPGGRNTATMPPPPPPATPWPRERIPAGYKAFQADERQYVATEEPVLTAADIVRVDWVPWTQFLSLEGEIAGGPRLSIIVRPESAKAKLPNSNSKVLVTAGGRVVEFPQRLWSLAIAVPFMDLPQGKQAALLPYLKGLPGSEGLPLTYTNGKHWVRPLPGLARVTVTAHFPDGRKPETLRCQRFEPWVNKGTGPFGTAVPTVIAGEAGFSVINITPGTWRYVIVGEDFAMEKCCWTVLDIKAGDDLKIDLPVHEGATVSGRVVRAEDGQPVEGVSVLGTARPATTDKNGRYVLQRVPTDQPKAMVRDENHVAQIVEFAGVKDGEALTAPDIKLQRGGLISGRVPLQPGMPSDLQWYGYVAPDLEGAEQYLYRSPLEGEDHHFRVGPLPAGTYTLKALALKVDSASGTQQRFEGRMENVRVEVGQEVKDVVIPVTQKTGD